MIKQRYMVTPAVCVILQRQNEILLLRRFNTGWADGQYCLPSGHIEIGETAISSAIREVKEEVGIDLNPADLEFKYVKFAINKSNNQGSEGYITIFFSANKWSGTPANMEPHKCDHMDWFSWDNLPDNMFGKFEEMSNIFIENSYGEFVFENWKPQ